MNWLEDKVKLLSPEEIERRLMAWADVTMLSLELRLALMRKRYPAIEERELKERMFKELWRLKEKKDER